MKKLAILVIAIIVGAIFLKPFSLWGFDVVDSYDMGDTSSVSALSNDLKQNPYEDISTSYKGKPNTSIDKLSSYAKKSSSYANKNDSEGYGSVAFDSITIAGRTIPVVAVGSTSVDSGNRVNKYGDRFYYGHNSGAVFGRLSSVGVGSVFSITFGGTTSNYRVAERVIFEKNRDNGRLQIGGNGNYMRDVAAARHGGVQYSISLMTCSGTSYGNGDASHRLVLFANRI